MSQTPPDTSDCFELFGIRRAYEINLKDLHRKYLALSRVIHPDMAGGESQERRSQALNLSAEFNRAYDTLREPVTRAEYLLTLAGGPTRSEDKSVSQSLLTQVLMLREEIEEASARHDASALTSLKKQITGRQQITMRQVADLARGLDQGGEQNRKQLRESLNALKYWNNLLDQIRPSAKRP